MADMSLSKETQASHEDRLDQDRPFDPNEHVRLISGQAYLDVKWRIVAFRQDHPRGEIQTELIAHDLKEGFALFKARVHVPGEKPGEGTIICVDHGSETKADFHDYIEKASTKAVGRALALMGYGTAGLLDDGDRLADAPVAQPGSDGNQRRSVDLPIGVSRQTSFAPGATTATPHPVMRQPGRPATPKQIDLITRTCARKGITVDDLERYASETYAVTLDMLTMGNASDIIGKILPDAFTGFGFAAGGPQDEPDGGGDALSGSGF